MIHIVRKSTPRFTKSPSLVFIRQVFTEIQRFKNFKICKEMYGTWTLCRMAIHFFVNFDIFKWLYLSYYWVYLHQTWGFYKTWSTLYEHFFGEQGWRSGESARLPLLWPRLDSRTRRHMWVEFVVGSRPCSEGFSPGSPVFLPPQKPTPNSNSIRK